MLGSGLVSLRCIYELLLTPVGMGRATYLRELRFSLVLEGYTLPSVCALHLPNKEPVVG